MLDKINIRPWQLSDLQSLVKYANNKNIASNLTDKFPHPYTEADGRGFLEHIAMKHPTSIFAIDYEGDAIGGVGLHAHEDVYRKNMELGYWLGEPFWGKGIMPLAIGKIVDYGFKTFDIVRIYARPYGRNLGSQRVLEKSGFQFEYKIAQNLIKNGVMEDEYMYSIRKKA